MIDGILPIYKERSYTSHDVVAKLRGILKQKQIGHTGTLDPDATGVLPVCLGSATKVSDMLSTGIKEYRATMLLGIETDTQDISGKVISTGPTDISEDRLKEAVYSFKGKYMQEPPMYSALKVNGKKLVDLARAGIEVERKKREVEIIEIEIEKITLTEVDMRVVCSKGTYIRTLCHDIGKKLGTFACMKSLIRTRHDIFELSQCISLKEVENLSKEELYKHIIKTEDYFSFMKKVEVLDEYHRYAVNGNKIDKDFIKQDSEEDVDRKTVRLYSMGLFIGIYEYIAEQKLYKPLKMFYTKDK